MTAHRGHPPDRTLEEVLRQTDLSGIKGILVYDPVPKKDSLVANYYAVLIDTTPSAPDSATAQLGSYDFTLTSPLSAPFAAGSMTAEARSIDQLSFETAFGTKLSIPQKKEGLFLVPTNDLASEEYGKIFIPDSTILLLMAVVRDVISHKGLPNRTYGVSSSGTS